jgi:hypothetical protein
MSAQDTIDVSVVTPERSRAAEIWKSSQEEKEEEKRSNDQTNST